MKAPFDGHDKEIKGLAALQKREEEATSRAETGPSEALEPEVPTSEAKKAYDIAVERIKAAQRNGDTVLSFNTKEMSALTEIPSEIVMLDGVLLLDFDNTLVRDLSPLSGLSSLTGLWLNDTLVSDLSPLSELSGLSALWLNNTPVSDLSPLSELSSLSDLRLNNTPVSDLSPLSEFRSLSVMLLSNASVSDLSPLSKLRNLSTLSLTNTPVSDLSPLSESRNLSTLLLGNTQVSDLFPLSELGSLSTLWLNDTSVNDLSPLSELRNLSNLSLTNTSVSDLSLLSGMESLRDLYLRNTPVNDLVALSGLPFLRNVGLDGSQVVDLRPLAHMSGVKLDELDQGVTFDNTPATNIDARLAQIAEIEDNAERVKTLFDYLADWEVPGEDADSVNVPKADTLFPVEEEAGKLEVAASCPTAQEHEDALKRSMHKSLPSMLSRLADAAGNQYARLCDAARRLLAMLEVPFEDLEMASIHLAALELRAAEEEGAEEGMVFETHLLAQLTAVNDATGALTVDHPLVNLLMERARKARENPNPDDDTDAQDKMSDAVAQDDAAMGDRLRNLEARVAHNSDAQAREAQKAVNRNVLWRIAVWSGAFVSTTIGGAVVTDLAGVPVVAFVKANLPLMGDVAATYGPVFANWFFSCLSKTPELKLIVDDYLRRIRGK